MAGRGDDTVDWRIVPWQRWRIDGRIDRRLPSDFALPYRARDRLGRHETGSGCVVVVVVVVGGGGGGGCCCRRPSVEASTIW